MIEVKAGYKQTEVGVIPEDWDVKKLGEIAPLQRGFDLPTSQLKMGTFPVVYSNGILNFHYKAMVKAPGVVTGRSGTIGKVNYIDKDYWPHNTTLWVTDFKGNIEKYIYFLYSYIKIEKFKTGSGVPTLNRNDVHNFQVRIPKSKHEQSAIATVLSDTDALIERLEELIAKKIAIKQGAMQQLLTPKEYWKEQTIFQIADSKKEFFDDGDWIEAEHITDKGIRLIQTGNIGIGTFVEKKDRKYIFDKSFYNLGCKELKVGDLLICRLAEPAGRACVLPFIGEEKVITSVDVTIFRPRKELVNRAFLSNIFSTEVWFKQIGEMCGGTTHKRISRSALGRTKIFLPPIEEQNTIAIILSDMDAEIEALEQKRDKYTMIKQGMMQELLTGKTRLV